MPSTNGVDEFLRRQTTLLDNLVTEINEGRYNDMPIEERRHSPSRRHDERNKIKSVDLLPRLKSQGMLELGTKLNTKT